MSDLTVFGSSGGSPFDAIRRVDERGENWSGRELMEIMGYTVWRDFSHAIERAKAACANSGADSGQHFADARKINDQGYRSADCRLTRYGAYLVALNGDPRKPEIAAAQTYFAIKTREAEVRLVSAVPALPDMNTAEGQVAVAEMLLELARTRVEQEREIQAQRARLDWAEPRAVYTDRHVDGAHDATTVRDFAKQADVGEKKLREWMTARRLVYKDATNQWKPYAQLGPRRHWFVLKDQPDAPRLHNGQLRQTLYITPAGKVGIADLLAKYSPAEENTDSGSAS